MSWLINPKVDVSLAIINHMINIINRIQIEFELRNLQLAQNADFQ